MNWIDFGRELVCSIRGAISDFSWRDRGKTRKYHSWWPKLEPGTTGIRSRCANYSTMMNCALWRDRGKLYESIQSNRQSGRDSNRVPQE